MTTKPRISAWLLVVALACNTPVLGNPSEQQKAAPDLSGQVLTMETALDLTQRYNPSRTDYALAESEARARADQAGRGPNPELDFEAENFAGSGDFSGFSGAEFTLALAQTFELGGKRSLARETADRQTELVRWEADWNALQLRKETIQAFTAVQAAQVKVQLAEEMAAVAEQDLEFIQRRLAKGAASVVDRNRAQVGVAASRLQVTTNRQILDAARVRLANLWNQPAATFASVQGDLEEISPLPNWEDLTRELANSPRWLRWDLEKALRRAEVANSAALGKIDLRATAGIRHYRDNGENAAVASLSIPLPVRNRNQGGQRAAQFHLERSASQRLTEQAAQRSDLSRQFEKLSTAREKITILREQILPLAEQSATSMNQAYHKGLYKLTDLLAVRRTWYQAQITYIDELASYWEASTEIELILGSTRKKN